MGQNQGREGDPGQDNSSAGPKEKGPNPDPGGETKEGNSTIETRDVVADEENAAGGSLDEGPGRESTSPTLERLLESYDKVCAPTDGGLVEGGDGEKEGGWAEPLASQQLNEIRQSDCSTRATREARSGGTVCEREDMEQARVGEAVDLRSMLEGNLDGELQENLRCDLLGKDKREWPYEKANGGEKETRELDEKAKMESVYEIENKRTCQDGNGKLEAGAADILNINTGGIVEVASDIGLTHTRPVKMTSEVKEKKDFSMDTDEQREGGVFNTGTSPAVHFLNQDKASLSRTNNENEDESHNERPFNTSNPGMNSPKSLKNITAVIQQVKKETEKPSDDPAKDVTKNPNTEHSPKNVEIQGRTRKDVYGGKENVAGFQPADDVRLTRSSLAGADIQNQAVSLEQARSPEDFSSLEVASKSPPSHAESHQQITAGELTQDENEKERQFNVSDMESFGTKETSLERSPAGGQMNKDEIGDAEEIKILESASKGVLCSHVRIGEIKDLSLRGTETEECNIAAVNIMGKNKSVQQSYEDETSSEDITDSHPPPKSDIQKDEMEDSLLLQKAKVHTEDSLKCFPQPEILNLPEILSETAHNLNPKLNSAPSMVTDADQHELDRNKTAGNTMSSERDNDRQSNQNIISSNADIFKETSVTGSSPETGSDPQDGPKVTPHLPSVDENAVITLSGAPQHQEKGFLNIFTNKATDESHQDGCPARAALSDSAANTSVSQDVQHSSFVCNLISMQPNEKEDEVQGKHGSHVQASKSEKQSSQPDEKQAAEISLNTDDASTIMEITQGPQKSKHVSDMIKETIELQRKMKEWTKPTETRVDLTLDTTQCVKVAQMKAAFDSPKKSPDKAIERKASVKKGKTVAVFARLFYCGFILMLGRE